MGKRNAPYGGSAQYIKVVDNGGSSEYKGSNYESRTFHIPNSTIEITSTEYRGFPYMHISGYNKKEGTRHQVTLKKGNLIDFLNAIPAISAEFFMVVDYIKKKKLKPRVKEGRRDQVVAHVPQSDDESDSESTTEEQQQQYSDEDEADAEYRDVMDRLKGAMDSTARSSQSASSKKSRKHLKIKKSSNKKHAVEAVPGGDGNSVETEQTQQ